MLRSGEGPKASEAEPVLVTRGLSKSYRTGHIVQGRRPALIDLDLQLLRGEILGYVGPNGSGKTTTFKLLMGLVRPDRGEGFILGEPLASLALAEPRGYLPEQPYLYDYLTPAEYLDYAGRLFGLPREARRRRARELLSLVGLERSADVPMRRFSKGMLQRAGLAQALVNRPGARVPRRADVRARPGRPASRARPGAGPSARPERPCCSRRTSFRMRRRSATAWPCCGEAGC